MNYLPLALIMGLFGSLHCAIMCGPLMLSLPLKKTSYLNSIIQLLLYQIGRVLVYTILGLMVGFIGNSFSVFTNQETLSLIIGVVLISFTFLQLSGRYFKILNNFQNKLITPIAKLMGKVYDLPFWGFFAGILNGLIPCGMVYLALATALNSANTQNGGIFMFLFGLGTTPMMLTISLGGFYLKKYIRFNTKKLIPYFMLFLGVLMILRSADLGIAFLSPNNAHHPKGNIEVCK